MTLCDSEKERHFLRVTEVREKPLILIPRAVLFPLTAGLLSVLPSPRRHGEGGYIRTFRIVSKRKKKKTQASLREIRKMLLDCRGVL